MKLPEGNINLLKNLHFIFDMRYKKSDKRHRSMIQGKQLRILTAH
jgi:hypothetical protein